MSTSACQQTESTESDMTCAHDGLPTLHSLNIDAWYTLPSLIVAAALKKCCITNATDGTEDSLLYEVVSDKRSASGSMDRDIDAEDM